MKFNQFAITLIAFLFLTQAHAQEITDRNHDYWFTLLSTTKLTEKWSFLQEVHIRRTEGMKEQQFLLRPTIHYHMNPNVMLSGGYTYIKNTPYGYFAGPVATHEHNVWEQVSLLHASGNWKFNHRYRLEHRFLEQFKGNAESGLTSNGYDYAQRFRYRYTMSVPLKKFESGQQLSVTFFDEIWLVLRDDFTVSGFNQNWFYTGLDYRFSEMFTLSAGYMQQIISHGATGYESNPTLQVTLFVNTKL